MAAISCGTLKTTWKYSQSISVNETRRWRERHEPDRLPTDQDGETKLLGAAMREHTQALGHLARYNGQLTRQLHRAIKQICDLRRNEHYARENRPYAQRYTRDDADPHAPIEPTPYVPPEAPNAPEAPQCRAAGSWTDA